MKPFKLSNRQQKELGERSSELRIAIPHPPDDVDALEYTRESIDVPGRWIREAEVLELTCYHAFGVTTSSAVMSSYLGDILHDDQDGSGILTFQVVAIVATIRQTNKPRHRVRTQWASRWGLT